MSCSQVFPSCAIPQQLEWQQQRKQRDNKPAEHKRVSTLEIHVVAATSVNQLKTGTLQAIAGSGDKYL